MSSRKLPPIRLILVALLISLGGSFHFGYQLTITNPCHHEFLHFVNNSLHSHFHITWNRSQVEALWSVIVASLFFGAMLGSLCLRQIADRLGRKNGLIFANALSTFSVVLSIVSNFTGNFGLYASSSPKYCRGTISMTMGVMVQFGTVIGSVFAMPQMLCRSIDWWLIYGAECSLLLIVLSILPFLHESPGTLVMRGQDMSARKSIQFFHNCSSTEQIEESLKEIKTNMKLNAKSVSMFKIWKEKGPNRRGTAVGCVVAFAMAFSGIAVINAFAVEIFRNTGMSLFHASLANVSLSVISLISCIISSCVIDRFGRRRLLLMTTSSILLLNVSIFTLMFCHQIYKYDWISVMLIFVIALFIFAFSTGPGPLCFFMTSEMVSQNARSAGQSWATLVQMTRTAICMRLKKNSETCQNLSISLSELWASPAINTMCL
ncbi:sugar transporter domain-containing protein [Ditylenchus destructor]|nr:sugar transporter domain-containing protein [Ditylenchus destructor]